MSQDYTDGNPVTEARAALDAFMKQHNREMNELPDGCSMTIGDEHVESETGNNGVRP